MEQVLSIAYVARQTGKSETQVRRDLDALGVTRDICGRRLPTEAHLRQLQAADKQPRTE